MTKALPPAPDDPPAAARRGRRAVSAADNWSEQIALINEKLAKVVADTEEGKVVLYRLLDEWAKTRSWMVARWLGLAAAACYPQWSPTAWKLLSLVSSAAGVGGPHG